jgi:hypothetical protein
MPAIDTSESHRALAAPWNQRLMPRLATTPIVFAKRCTNMSMNALAAYFSSREVGV